MLISIIICTYNRFENLKKTLSSILAQENDSDFDYEIIVVDNNSKDKTKETVENFCNKFVGRLRYIFEPKQGLSYARNKGIEEAKGDILAFTDDDCCVDDGWLNNIHKVFIDKDVDLLGGKVLPVFKMPVPLWLSKDISKGPLAFFDLGNDYIENNIKRINPVGANFIMRKLSCLKFGNFEYSGRAEDSELTDRWNRLGAKICYSPAVVVYHYFDESRLNKNYFRKFYFLCGKNSAILHKEKIGKGRLLFGVSLWIYKELLLALGNFLKGVFCFKKNNFSHELLFIYNLGIIFGSQGFKTKFENLR